MPVRPRPVDVDQVDDEAVEELLETAAEQWYGDTAYFGAMAHVPALLKTIVAVFDEFGRQSDLDDALFEMMRIKIAECHQCGYCATVRHIDVRDDVRPKEDAILGEVDESGLARDEYLAVRLAERLSVDPHRLSDEHFSALRTAFTEAEIVELLLFASLEVGLDRFCIALELQPTEESEYPDQVQYPHGATE